jgi:hypothetical protein
MKLALTINRYVIALFALSSGIFKLVGGRADVEVFSHLGMTATVVAAFGAVQALGGLALLFAKARRPGAVVVVLSNAVATIGLFAAHVIPFGVASILFIAMAALELRPGFPTTASRSGALA